MTTPITRTPEQALAIYVAEMLETIEAVEAQLVIERQLRSAAVDALRDLTLQHDRLRDQHHATRAAYRALRERLAVAS